MAKSKIAIVDDDEHNVKLVVTKLEENFEVVWLNKGSELLRRIKENDETFDVNLILLDVNMPELNGHEICTKIRTEEEYKSFKEIPIIFLTANDTPEDVKKGFEVGGSDYVKKPFNFIELNARIKRELKLFHSQKILIENERLSTFKTTVVTMNHELNNPLTIALGNLEALEKKLGQGSPYQKYLDGIHIALKRVATNIKKISVIEKLHVEKYRDDGDATLFKLDK